MATLWASWGNRRFGLGISVFRLRYVAWADGTWLIASSPAEFNIMLRDWKQAARAEGLELHITKCKGADVRREDQMPAAVPAECAELHAMPRVQTGEPPHILGAPVSTQATTRANSTLS